jgi:putative ABC transport system substrate-binding protein
MIGDSPCFRQAIVEGPRSMNRRKFMGGSASAALLAGCAPGWPGAASAQQPNLPGIGFLDGVRGHLNGQVSRGLRENGITGFKIEYSGWIGKKSQFQADQIASCAAELVKRRVALILAFSTRAASAAKTVTNTTPIIFLADDPVTSGLADSLDRPGGNLTGAAYPVSGSIAKRIEILRQLFPAKNLVVLVTDPTNAPAHDIEVREAEAATKALGLELSIIDWTGEHDFEIDLVALPRDRKAALVFGEGLPFFVWGVHLDYLAARHGIPAIHGFREATEEGGLASFGPRFADGGHLMGVYAARVLKGEKPADLPVQQITKTELVINLGTAKSRGIQIPPTLLARADEVIE